MAPPTTPLHVGLTLRPGHDPARRAHIARLAARLGFRTIWLPADALPADLPALREAAQPAALGLVLEGLEGLDGDAAPDRLAALDPEVLLEIHAAPQRRDRLFAALGHRWRRVWLPWYDRDAAGTVVLAERHADRADLAAAVKAASGAGDAAGRVALTVALTVSIGRTRSEAEARALRDPALSGVHDPRRAGLFGTLEEAQEQARELAQAGATAIRATLADEADVADLLAHLRAATVAPVR